MAISFDQIFLSVIGLALLVALAIGTWKFVKKYDNPGAVFDYKVVRQLPLWFALILLAVNIAMAMYSAGVEPEDPTEKMSVVTRATLHITLETIGFLCLLGIPYFLFCTVFCIIIWRRYNKELKGSNVSNKQEKLKYRLSAIRFTFLFGILVIICLLMGIYGPYQNTYLVAVAVNQDVQLEWWFRDTFPFYKSLDYTMVPVHFLDHTLLSETDFTQRGTNFYLPEDYKPFKDMVYRLKCMVILYYSNLVFAIGKGLLSVPHYMIVLEKDMQDLVEGKTDLAATVNYAANTDREDRRRSNRRGTRGRGSSRTDDASDEDRLSQDDIEEYLREAIEFYGYEGDEVTEKIDEAMDNYLKEDEERVIVQVSNKLASIHQSIISFEEKSAEYSNERYEREGMRTAKSIERILKGSVQRAGGFGISLSRSKAERKFKR